VTGREDDEGALIRRAQAGDRDAFSAIARHYLPRVYRVAFRVVRNHEDASDVAQETLIRAYGSLDRFDASRPVFPWLYQIARNLSLNRIERIRRRETGLPDPDAICGGYAGPEEAAVGASEAQRIREAMGMLTEQHRQVIELNHFQECSYQEIAGILGIPIGTVMSRLYHARRHLRPLLERDHPTAVGATQETL
jgi:RNA polymerase sigma-70 factor (ECF subfamily)